MLFCSRIFQPLFRIFRFFFFSQYINGLSEKINVKTTLIRAAGFYQQLLEVNDQLPDDVRVTLGFIPPPPTDNVGQDAGTVDLEVRPTSSSNSDVDAMVMHDPFAPGAAQPTTFIPTHKRIPPARRTP
ncbi:unnamed protein product [Dibothriocephalus latus]|uniref:Uncharacterized protein n=1 Tax=Dibothriocephalus latus TaxID=60516 RepID=A0A3P7NEB1_DIBLA|nr:unnamed protein product [Dibothriocephalus latus]